MAKLAAIAVGTILFGPAMAGGPAHLVEDIRTVPDQGAFDGMPFGFVGFGDVAYFSAYDESNLLGLWRTDGTEAGTELVLDIPDQAGFGSGVVFRGALYMPGPRPTDRLWRSDGTPGGTVPLPTPGPVFTVGSAFARTSSAFFFRAHDAQHGSEIWRSDGTPEGTHIVRDIRPGATSSGPLTPLFNPVALGEIILFCADDGVNGPELWRSDGTEAGTVLVRAIHPSTDSGSCLDFAFGRGFVRAGGLLFFFADDGGLGRELWRTDGTHEGTYPVEDLTPGPSGANAESMAVLGDLLLFLLRAPTPTHRGETLWRSDGTAEGTYVIATLPAIRLRAAENQAFFVRSEVGHLDELWRTDGTAEGTYLVKDVHPGPGGAGINPLGVLGPVLLFTTGTAAHGFELWRSDGTEAGTYLVKDIRPGPGSSQPESAATIGGLLYFSADDGVHGRELWRSDGTAEGTLLLEDFGLVHGSQPAKLTDVAGMVIFTADDGAHGTELWRSDGSAEGTEMIAELIPGIVPYTGIELFDSMTAAGGKLFTAVLDPNTGYSHLVATDGSAAGTVTIAEPLPWTGMIPVGDRVWFGGYEPVHGMEPWVSDGTAAGTQRLLDLTPGPGYSVAYAGALGDRVIFAHSTPTSSELWKSDGTPQGSGPFADLFPGFLKPPYLLEPFTRAGAASYFFLFTPGPFPSRADLWRTDGTEAGTFALDGPEDLYQRLFPGHYQNRVGSAGGQFFASLWDASTRRYDLWGTDAAGQALVRVKEGVGGVFFPSPDELTGCGALLFFPSFDEERGLELWKSDGTTEGTTVVRDLYPDHGSAAPRSLAAIDGVLLFAAADGVHGHELWRSDGTPEGTVLVQEISPGPASSNPSGFRKSGARVYFSANDGVHGEELWSGWAAIVTGQPARAVSDLRAMVLALGLPQGQETGSLAKLDAAAGALAAGDPSAAIGPLRGFLGSLAALRGWPVTELADLAEQTIALLGGQSPPQPRQRRERVRSAGAVSF